MAKQTTADVKTENTPVPPTLLDTLNAKLAVYAEHPDLFANEIAAVESAIQGAVFQGEIGAILDKHDITRIRGAKVDGVWSFTTLATGTDKSLANPHNKRNGRAWPHDSIRYDGKVYSSFAALCRDIDLDYGAANARAYLQAKNPAVYAAVVRASKAA